MPSLLLDTKTFLTYLRSPSDLGRTALDRLRAVSPEQVFVSVLTLHSLRRMNRDGTVSDKELDELLERLRPTQILEIDLVTRLLADSLDGPLEFRLIAATARRRRLTLLAHTTEYDGYNIDVIISMKREFPALP
ncbi:MAG TPA: hypothetical protein VKB93_08665 [Thermoanaerobaculia bacterium]|nr:hypothetical protein [Thermoanaerobaculia bacterium]